MAENIITSQNKDSYFSGNNSKVASHGKNMIPGTGFPSLHAYYGPYENLELAYNCMVARYRNAAGIPRGLTVAVIDNENGTLVEYQFKKETPSGGYLLTDLEPKVPTYEDIDADDITFSPSSSSPSGSVGAKIKEIAKAVEDNAGSTIEPVPDATVNLAGKATSGASFTYDADNKYVYNGNPTTMYIYETSGTLYAVFKVSGSDLFLEYTISALDEYTFSQTYDIEHLPSAARAEFEMGKYAAIKRISGVAGESWRFDSISLLCTRNNNALRHRLLNIALYGEVALDWRVLVKAEDGGSIFIYSKDGSNYRYHSTVASSSVAAFKYYDKFFDYKEASGIGYDDSNTQFGSNIDNVQEAIEKLAKMRYEVIDEDDYGGIDDPTGNTYYDLTTTGQTSIDVSDITIANNNEVIVLFKTDSQETCSLITNEDQRVIGGTSFSTDTVYVLSVLRGVICICEAPLAPSV